jgi:hypothetical protein
MEINEIQALKKVGVNFVIVQNHWWNKYRPVTAFLNHEPKNIGTKEFFLTHLPEREFRERVYLTEEEYDLLIKNNWLEESIHQIHFGVKGVLQLNEEALNYLKSQ